jgi:hypothetical protein
MVAGLLGICYSVLIIGFIVKAKIIGGSQTISKFQIIVKNKEISKRHLIINFR